MEPEKKVEIGQNMRDIEQAPKIFRERLLALKEAGVLDDPAFKQAVLDAVEEVLAEQKAVRPEEPCSKSSPKLEDDLHRVFEKARKAILVSRNISL